MNIPNQLTMFRVVLIPAFIFLLMTGRETYAAVVFIAASLTDALDGYIARKYNLVTNFGKIMDPLADKLLTAAAFVCLVELSVIPAWMVIVILAREFTITALRAVAAGEGVVIAAGTSGKIKTILQMAAIILLLFAQPVSEYWSGFGLLCDAVLWAAVLMTIISGVEYIVKNKKLFSLEED